MSLIPLLRLPVAALPILFFLVLSGCAHNRVDLSPYTPQGPIPGASAMQRPFVVAPLADHRFRFFEYAPTGMVDTVGWGEGTGTLYTPQNIPNHVTTALVTQFRSYGMSVSYDPNVHCRIGGTRAHPVVKVTGTVRGLVLCGSILDYQFELDHPRVIFGFISTLDMAAGASLSAQASLHLFLVRARSGRILWEGVELSSREKGGIHPPHLKRQAVAYLDKTLSRVLAKTARAMSGATE